MKRLLLAAAAALGWATPAFASYTLTTISTLNYNGSTAGLIADANGNLYGTRAYDGTYSDGTVFKLAAGTHAYSEVAVFYGANGANPSGGLIADASGNLYGVTAGGGAYNEGTIYELAAGTHALTTVATFNGANGSSPDGVLLADAHGNLYGTTMNGGAFNYGSVFELAAGTHVISTLASFNNVNGINPYAGVVADAQGNLYGTSGGGANTYGTVYEVAAGTHTLSTLVAFNGTDGATPFGGLFADANGNLYGTTSWAGPARYGTLFEIAAGTHAFSTLVAFDGTNGSGPEASLIPGPNGSLYSTTSGRDSGFGTVYEFNPITHAVTTLATFDGTNGANPVSPLLLDSSGNFYGTTEHGGPAYGGIVFELSPTPEPGSLLLLAVGGTALLARRRRK